MVIEAIESTDNMTFTNGELAEWSNAAVLKTVDCNRSGGSNPSLSAILINELHGCSFLR